MVDIQLQEAIEAKIIEYEHALNSRQVFILKYSN